MTEDSATATSSSPSEPTPRSTSAVLGIIAALVAVPILAVLVVLLVRGGGGAASGGADLAEGVRDGRIQAVYMANDAVYFGRLEAGEGDWLELRDAFFLRASAAKESRDGEDTGAADLVPIQQQAGGDGTLVINSREVSLVQNLAADAEIAQRIEDAVG